MDGHVLMIRRYRDIGVVGALASTILVASLVAGGCASTDCSFTATCLGATVDGNGGGGDVVMLDGGFDAPLDPCVNTPSDPKCLDDTAALFVSTKADASTADGTRARPFKTITAGLGAVSATRKRLYVCEGDYPENVSVQTTVSILGGLTCDWMGKGTNPRIAPPKGVALSILKSNGVVVTDVNIEGSADAQVDGDSAIAVLVSESNAALFRRVAAKAGAGTKGTKGGDGDASPNYTGVIASPGVNTSSPAGAAAPMCAACVDGSFSTAGKGKTASGAGPDTGTAMPAVGNDNSGGTVSGSCVAGKPGAAGLAAAAAAATSAPGALKATGWESAISAKNGANGNPAQGGGGAGSNTAPALGGGSGGCGGCGGSGGAAGGNGGSSFALLSFDSDLSIEDSTLTAGPGGLGGLGGKGQDGQFRGGAGTGACSGGEGGHGAGGGGGGGGAGGHSVAIAHTGKAPMPTNSMLKHATEGGSGGGGGGGTSTGNPGKPGDNGAKGSGADILSL